MLLTDVTSNGKANIIKKLQYQANITVKVTKILCLNQLPYLYRTVEDSINDRRILEIKGV